MKKDSLGGRGSSTGSGYGKGISKAQMAAKGIGKAKPKVKGLTAFEVERMRQTRIDEQGAQFVRGSGGLKYDAFTKRSKIANAKDAKRRAEYPYFIPRPLPPKSKTNSPRQTSVPTKPSKAGPQARKSVKKGK